MDIKNLMDKRQKLMVQKEILMKELKELQKELGIKDLKGVEDKLAELEKILNDEEQILNTLIKELKGE